MDRVLGRSPVRVEVVMLLGAILVGDVGVSILGCIFHDL